MNCKICLEPLHCDCLCLTCRMAREQAQEMSIGKSEQMRQFAAENNIPILEIKKP